MWERNKEGNEGDNPAWVGGNDEDFPLPEAPPSLSLLTELCPTKKIKLSARG